MQIQQAVIHIDWVLPHGSNLDMEQTMIIQKKNLPTGSPMPMLLLLAMVGLVASGGCSGGPSRIVPPSISASGSAKRAMEMYDTDGNGLLSEAELAKAPALRAAIKTLDTDGDGKVSEDEIATRIRSWQASRAGISSVLCYVTLNGRLLPNATVTFEPEPFLGGEIQTASGVTNFNGVASPYIPKENRPSPDMPPGLQLGFYKVRVSKIVNGKETIPSRYNSETVLGQQVANDDPAILSHRILLKLKSR